MGEVNLAEASLVNRIFEDNERYLIAIECGSNSLLLEGANDINCDLWVSSLLHAKATIQPNIRKITSPQESGSDEIFFTPEKEGFLLKRGETVKSWKKRWFLLQFPNLYYFSSSQISSNNLTGVIPLDTSVIMIKKQDKSINKVTQFQIETRTRTYYLRADTEEDLEQWVNTIRRSRVDYIRNSSQIQSQTTASMSSLPPPNTTTSSNCKSGYLLKRGRSNKTWLKRYFLLSSSLLSYFESHTVCCT